MKSEDFEKFKEQVWATRISRINTEKRLINKEIFFQGINVYYSCITIIFSILSYVNNDDSLSLLTVFMTISLLVVILYLNSQKYLEHAREYRKNYTQINELEFELKHISENEEEKIREIESRYSKLLDSSGNHSTYDYYWTVYYSNETYKNKRWKNIKWKFRVSITWRFFAKLFIIILPVVLYMMREVI